VKQYKILSADVFVENVGTSEQLENLKKEVLDNKTKDPVGIFFTNENCWRSQFQYSNISWLLDALEKLVNQAIEYYSKVDPLFIKKLSFYKNPTVDYWTNVNDPMGKNSLHNHGAYHFVACYYIQAEGTGDLVFHNPANLLEECNPNGPFVSRIGITPKNGDLVVWPSWVPHEVEINTSNKQRINIAFNIKF
jgi:uncharacterized protein (TIGR02466 family)